MKRRQFIRAFGAGSIALGASTFPLQALGNPDVTKLTILHTNDVHSRIDPFPMDGSRNQGLGGAARRARLIEQIRAEEEHVLLLDAGDIFQGTPYFNYFGGELEFKLMSSMGYDAATIGNHDFDAGIDGLEKQLPHANFPLLISNYDFSDSIMKNKTLPYKILKKGNLKIGVFGLGIELAGLVPKELYKNTIYMDPLAAAKKYAGILKQDNNCDYVICLSHLGHKYRGNKVSDLDVAAASTDLDLIIGGHTHTFLKKPAVIANKKEEAVLVNQAGWAGILLGRIDVYFERNTKKNCMTCKNLKIDGK